MEAVVPPSHGNLNYVYRVWDGKGHSIYIKQAGSEARISGYKTIQGQKPPESGNPYAGGPVCAEMCLISISLTTVMCALRYGGLL